jgi:hypothetical protein
LGRIRTSEDIGIWGGEAAGNEARVERRSGDEGEGGSGEDEEREEDEKGAGHEKIWFEYI